MKQTLYIVATILLLCFAGNCSDNPEENPTQDKVTVTKDNCPNCGDKNCIYVQIEEEIVAAGGDGTDQQIYDAATKVFILRNITDSATIKNILSNYYL